MNSVHRASCAASRPGFSVVQIVVLIAIIALLVALLVPAAERVRQQANLALCRDNLRRVGAELLLYAQADGGGLPVSPTLGNPQTELLCCLAAAKLTGDPRNFYCPSQRRPELCYSDRNFRAGFIGYYYYSAADAGDDPALSKFLRDGVQWPRELNAGMDPKSWVMSDIWVSGLPTAHPGYRKGVNYLMLDGSVGFVQESPRQEFH